MATAMAIAVVSAASANGSANGVLFSVVSAAGTAVESTAKENGMELRRFLTRIGRKTDLRFEEWQIEMENEEWRE